MWIDLLSGFVWTSPKKKVAVVLLGVILSGGLSPEVPANAASGSGLLSETWRIRLSGYLEGSYTQNFGRPSNRMNQLRIFDVNSNLFRPNLAQVVLARDTVTTGSAMDRLGFHVKVNAGRDSDFIGGVNLSQWVDLQEFYLQYLAPIGHGLKIRIGQINSLVGYEKPESPYNANYSRSWLFGIGQPFTTRGFHLYYQLNEQVKIAVGVIGYINSARVDSDHDRLVEYALTFTPSNTIEMTWYGLAGPREGLSGTSGGILLLTGGYLRWKLTPQTVAVLEAYYANQPNSSLISSGRNARWNGIAAYMIHDFTNEWGIRVRGELFEDAGGFVGCQGTTEYQPRANVCFGATSAAPSRTVAQTMWETTATLQYRPIPSLLTRLEYRYDKSNEPVFQIGERASTYQSTVSMNIIYFF